MDVPVVAAARLEGDVEYRHLRQRQRRKIALSDKILSVCVVRFTDGKEDLVLILVLCGQRRRFFVPDLLSHAKRRPALRPADIHGRVRDDRSDFIFGHAVLFCVLQMIAERAVGHARRHQGNDRHNTFCFGIQTLSIPDLAEQNVVVEVREHRRKIAELVTTRSLYDFFVHFQSPVFFISPESIQAES